MSLNRASSENQTVTEQISSALGREMMDLQNLTKQCSIYRVPQRLCRVNEKAYTPQVVSIGPTHHGKTEFKAMEEHKRRYLQHFLHLGSTVGLDDYVDFVTKKEKDLRNCYAETIYLNTEEFIKMILIDSAFLILILVQSTFKLDLTDDRLLDRPVMMYEVRDDILLLENQLPFFILEELFELSEIAKYFQHNYNLPSDLREKIDLIKLTYGFFEEWIAIPEMINKIYGIRVEHLLHFLRICYIPQTWHLERKATKTLSLPSAMELYQAGVKFEPVRSEKLFDITFRNGILKIPQLELIDSTLIIFHNLCAYEQCHCIPSYSPGHIFVMDQECPCLFELISDYISIMSQLVKSPKDVELLIQKGIIVNRASSNERVASFFPKLAVGVNVSSLLFCYCNVIQDLNKYCEARWPKWKATLKKDYFKNPWAGISVSAAGILLLLTIIQTVCSILQVKNPSSN